MSENSSKNQKKYSNPDIEVTDCLACGNEIFGTKLYSRYKVCYKCNFHFHINARERLVSLIDRGTFKEYFNDVTSLNPIEKTSGAQYKSRIKKDRLRTGLSEAIVTGTCTIGGSPTVIMVLDFGFLGGSMGLVVGEKVALSLELAEKRRMPVLCVITSGGSRIQEGVLSLMQMAKTVVALDNLHKKGLPIISILGNPSTGQVIASFVSLSDIIIAEPGAHIGYAPYRSIKEVSVEIEPSKYTSEIYQKHGLIDRVVSRQNINRETSTLLDLLSPKFNLEILKTTNIPETSLLPLKPWEMVQLARNINRPQSRYYISEIFANFIELHGDRLMSDDPSIIIGLARLAGESVMVIAQQKTVEKINKSSNKKSQKVKIKPEGFRKAKRAIELAERFGLPIISLVDSLGPELSLQAEYKGLANSISELISSMTKVEVATISVIIGEGGSETGLSFSVSDRTLMMQNAIFTPISPEDAARSQLKDSGKIKDVVSTLKLTSTDCLQMGIIDYIVPEPVGGAHSSPQEAARLLKIELMKELGSLKKIYPRTLSRRRKKKFRQMGEYSNKFRSTLKSELKIWQSAFTAGVRALKK